MRCISYQELLNIVKTEQKFIFVSFFNSDDILLEILEPELGKFVINYPDIRFLELFIDELPENDIKLSDFDDKIGKIYSTPIFFIFSKGNYVNQCYLTSYQKIDKLKDFIFEHTKLRPM